MRKTNPSSGSQARMSGRKTGSRERRGVELEVERGEDGLGGREGLNGEEERGKSWRWNKEEREIREGGRT